MSIPAVALTVITFIAAVVGAHKALTARFGDNDGNDHGC